ncbi:MAG: hypothetical protein IKM00_10405 [Clostridia bacterium]|nr:hypothetical protein [Clostridia bacterium]
MMKKIIAGILTIMMMLSFTACSTDPISEDPMTYDTQNKTSRTEASASTDTSPSTTNPSAQPIWEKPVAPSGWEYPEIDLSEGKYTPSALDPAALARKLGYKDGTYEYEYFRALSGISFYARIASNKVSSATKNTAVSSLAKGFFEVISRDTFLAPYADILYHTFSLLKKSDFTLFADNEALIAEYQNALSYQWDKPTEIWYTAALSFTDMDTKLTEYALALLTLKEKYPDYAGEFTLSAEAISQAQAIVDSCKAVADSRGEQWAAWEKYFKEATPKVTVTSEIIPEKDAVKLIFTSDHPLSVQIDPKYIADFKGEVTQNGNAVGYHYEPMGSPVICYIPIGLFYSTHGEFSVTKYVTNDLTHTYKETVTASADLSSCFSDEAIAVSDPFLDAVLKAEFGGSYNERALSRIRSISVSYRRTDRENVSGAAFKKEPSVLITYYDKTLGDGGSSYHTYSDYYTVDWTGDFPLCVWEDMEYFPLLESVSFHQDGSSQIPLPEEYLDRILIKEYTADDFS